VRVVDTASAEELIEAVRNVGLLNSPDIKPYENADISIGVFDIGALRPTTLYVLRKNLETQQRLAAALEIQGYHPLELDGSLVLKDGEEKIGLIPPIVERDPVYGDCLIDGAHRTYVGRMGGRRIMRAVHIVGADPNYPIYAHPNEWDEIVEHDDVPSDPKLKKRYRDDAPQKLYRDLSALNGSTMRLTQ